MGKHNKKNEGLKALSDSKSSSLETLINKTTLRKTIGKVERQTDSTTQNRTDIARGTINHSALGALVTSKVFCMRVEKAKKGKGSFKRKTKHSGKEYYQITA